MSYILEALRKAERERSLGQVPTLEAKSDVSAETPRQLWPWLLAGALVVNAIVLALWLWSPRTPDGAESLPAPVAQAVVPEYTPPQPAISDYIPPSSTVLPEPISEPPVVTVREPAVPEPVAPVEPPDTFVDEPAIEEAPVARDVTPLRDMPPEFRRSLPELKMDAHFYTEVQGRSFVMINLRKYKPGERLSEGPQVVEIVPEGVILAHQGQQFLLTP